MKKAVVICGSIASGKSSVTAQLAERYGWDVLSFGRYVKHVAHTKHLGSSRETYQNLGSMLVKDLGYRKFLEEVISFYQPKSSIHLIDGIREIAMLDEVKLQYDAVFTIYLNLVVEERYKRYIKRADSTAGYPSLSFSDFLKIENHPIEAGISQLGLTADLKIESSGNLKHIVDVIDFALKRAGVLVTYLRYCGCK